MASNKRIRGLAIHRSILVGSTATPLTPAEKLAADPIHTHKWTIAVRSAASNPLPTHALDEKGQPKAVPTNPTPNAGAAAGTRGRDVETDYHRHVGGKDDVSHFIRRVQFKLHESFPSPLRTVDKPPFQVTETGWGEFEIIVKIWWVAEASEKFLQTQHYLKLHPWPNMPLPDGPPVVAEPAAAQLTDGEASATATTTTTTADQQTNADAATTQEPPQSEKADEPAAESEDTIAKTESTAGEGGATEPPSTGETTTDATTTTAPGTEVAAAAAAPPAQQMAPVVHSWQYDEIVFPEPTEAFYQTLISHPPTPLHATALQAFTDPKTSRLQRGFTTTTGTIDGSQVPPYPLYSPSSVPYMEGISQASMQAEADRLDIARIEAVKELGAERDRLIEVERELRRVRRRIDEIAGTGAGSAGLRG